MNDTPDSAAERISRWSGWGGRFISAIVGIAVTVVAALILGKLQAHEPHLVYSSTESLPFSGPSGDVSIYQVTLSNDGKKEVYDVAFAIRIPAAKIDQYKVTADPLLNVSGAASGDTVSFQVPNLNPSEFIQISLLASGSQNLPARPQVTARGKGTVGSEKPKAADKSWFDTIPLVSLMAATLSVFVSSVAWWVLRSRTAAGSWSGSDDDQREVLAYICRAYGLVDFAEQYSARAHQTTYWAEADRLGQMAVDTGGEKMATIERALLGLIEYGKMAHASKAIVYFNVALINRMKKDDAAYKRYLQMAKDISTEEIERRLRVDPRFANS